MNFGKSVQVGNIDVYYRDLRFIPVGPHAEEKDGIFAIADKVLREHHVCFWHRYPHNARYRKSYHQQLGHRAMLKLAGRQGD